MGGNLLSSFLENNKLSKESVVIIHPDKKIRESLSDCFKCKTDTLENCKFNKDDILFIGLKPQTFLEEAENIKRALDGITLTIVSIMASISCSLITKHTLTNNIIRLMPNLAVKIGDGVTGILSSNENIKDYQDYLKFLLKDSGIVIDLQNDDEVAAITALSGSGPAFFYYFMEAMINAGEKTGFSRDISEKLVKQTILGSFNLISKEELSISELREKVTSKGGTTEVGLKILSDNNFIPLIDETIKAAKKKAAT